MSIPLLVLTICAFAIGNAMSGRRATSGLAPSLTGMLVVLVVVMNAFAKTGHSQLAAIATVLVWGIAAFVAPPLNMPVAGKAVAVPRPASLKFGAFDLGNAVGARLGGLAIKYAYALDILPWVSATVTAAALAAPWFSARMKTPSYSRQSV